MEHIRGIWNETLTLWFDMGIYLVFGFTVAGILSRVLRSETVARHLGGHSLSAVAKASLFGVPLPLCSCGVLPVGLSLRSRGAGRPATTSFLISTPQTGVDSIIVTWGFLGPFFALLRPVAAFVNGLLGGAVAAWFEKRDAVQAPDHAKTESCPVGGAPSQSSDDPGPTSLWGHIKGAIGYGYLEFPREISSWLVASILVAGVLAHFLPDEGAVLEHTLGTGLFPMLVMLAVGIPLYICSTASVPIVAVLVTKGGLSAGAALVFLMAGPATNAAGLIMIARKLGKRTAAIYVTSIIVTALAFGLVLDAGYAAMGTTLAVRAAEHMHHEMLPMWLQWIGAVGLLAVVTTALVRNRLRAVRMRRESLDIQKEESMELKVEGMTCPNCAAHVQKAAESVEGVESARVDLKAGILHVAGDGADRETIRKAVEDGGYQVAEG